MKIPNTNNKTAVIFLCHFYDEDVHKAYEQLIKESPKYIDVYWGADVMAKSYNDLVDNLPDDVNRFDFSMENISKYLPCLATNKNSWSSLVPIWGREYLIPIYFNYITKEQYNHVWIIEYDVRYTGNWAELFDYFNKFPEIDFLSNYIEFRNEVNNSWVFWKFIRDLEKIDAKTKVKSFNVIYRISKRAILEIKKALEKDFDGFYEILPATVLYNKGYKLCNISSYKIDEFTPKDLLNKFTTSKEGLHNGSIRWSPTYSKSEISKLKKEDKEVLIHPVKKGEQKSFEGSFIINKIYE